MVSLFGEKVELIQLQLRWWEGVKCPGSGQSPVAGSTVFAAKKVPFFVVITAYLIPRLHPPACHGRRSGLQLYQHLAGLPRLYLGWCTQFPCWRTPSQAGGRDGWLRRNPGTPVGAGRGCRKRRHRGSAEIQAVSTLERWWGCALGRQRG